MDSIDVVKDLFELSPEQEERLQIFIELLIDWQRVKNLVSRETLKTVWKRHVADSMQTHSVLPDANRWIDFGSGAGFPGIITATMIASRNDAKVHLIESNNRKASFLRTVIRETGIPASVICDRVETVMENWAEPVDAISARAFAPLEAICRYSERLISTGAKGVFHRGKDYLLEIEHISQKWKLDMVTFESQTDENSRIVIISKIESYPKQEL